MTHPVYIGMRQVAACTTPEAQAAAMRLLETDQRNAGLTQRCCCGREVVPLGGVFRVYGYVHGSNRCAREDYYAAAIGVTACECDEWKARAEKAERALSEKRARIVAYIRKEWRCPCGWGVALSGAIERGEE